MPPAEVYSHSCGTVTVSGSVCLGPQSGISLRLDGGNWNRGNIPSESAGSSYSNPVLMHPSSLDGESPKPQTCESVDTLSLACTEF